MSDSPQTPSPNQPPPPKQIQRNPNNPEPSPRDVESEITFPVCPVCGGELIDIRQKLVCSRCHTICETCCEGGRG